MKCPFCNSDDTAVKDSRPTEDGIRRRRECPKCNSRFTTFERVQLRELTVVKRGGQKRPYDREKVVRSIQIATRKRPVTPEQIDQLAAAVTRGLERKGSSEVKAEEIGSLIMEGLRRLDKVAYIRYASVYKDFSEASDFEQFVGMLSADQGGA